MIVDGQRLGTNTYTVGYLMMAGIGVFNVSNLSTYNYYEAIEGLWGRLSSTVRPAADMTV